MERHKEQEVAVSVPVREPTTPDEGAVTLEEIVELMSQNSDPAAGKVELTSLL